MNNITLEIKPFIIEEDGKEQAKKVLEEAAEVYGAWQKYTYQPEEKFRDELLDEIADTIQAAVNMAAFVGVTSFDLVDAMNRCEQRNRDRGRYDNA